MTPVIPRLAAAGEDSGMSLTAPSPRLLDVRTLGPCVERKAFVLSAFDALAPGESLIVANDHLPVGLRRHLEELREGAFAWSVLEAGPELFRVEIRRVA
jgi:uncharacterized protein (DUF2249 family)